MDMTGQTVNGIYIMGRTSGNSENAYWMCKCPYCGRRFVARGIPIRAGRVKSCGCKSRNDAPIKTEMENTYEAYRAKRKKYGCYLCAERCEPEQPCRYADILDQYASYEDYDTDMVRLIGRIMHE